MPENNYFKLFIFIPPIQSLSLSQFHFLHNKTSLIIMKKLCIFLFMSISATTFGQVIPKGTRFIGGDLSFDSYSAKSSNNSKTSTNLISLSPSITVFEKDNFAVTYQIGYGLSFSNFKSSDNSYNRKEVGHTITAGVYLSNYKMLSEKFGISVRYGGGIGFNTRKTNIESNASTITSKPVNGGSLSFSAGPGIIYLLNEKFALEGNASIVNLGFSYTGDSDANTVNISTNLSASPGIGIGFRYFMK
jgi:hypothetical protein